MPKSFRNIVIPLVHDIILNSLGPIKPSLALCTLTVFVLVYFALWKGVKSTGKVILMTRENDISVKGGLDDKKARLKMFPK